MIKKKSLLNRFAFLRFAMFHSVTCRIFMGKKQKKIHFKLRSRAQHGYESTQTITILRSQTREGTPFHKRPKELA